MGKVGAQSVRNRSRGNRRPRAGLKLGASVDRSPNAGGSTVRKLAPVLASLLLLMANADAQRARKSPWEVGRPAPHVHLPDIRTGEAVDLATFRGKKVLIAEFASW